MNKKLKIFLLTSTAVIVLGVGYILYLFQFKEYEVADEEVDEIMENPYDITLPNGTKLVLEDEEQQDGEKKEKPSAGESASGAEDNGMPKDQQSAVSSSTTGASDQSAASGSSAATKSSGTTATGSSAAKPSDDVKQPSGESDAPASAGGSAGSASSATSDNKEPVAAPSAGNAATGKPDKKESVGQIKSKYEPTVSNLQGQVDSKINALIGRAKNEYSTKKANGESVNYAYFYSKYMSAAEGLEAQTDAVFNGVVSSLEKDLQANGYDKSYSKSVKEEYAAQKKARRDGIMKKAMGK